MGSYSNSRFIFGFLVLGMSLCAEVMAQQERLMPLPPRIFTITKTPPGFLLEWTTHGGESDPEAWEIYRTVSHVDNLPYEQIQSLPGSARSFLDAGYSPDTGYFYYIVAVGKPTPVDPLGLAGTPDGRPFRSSRYFTQSNDLTAIGVRPGIDADTLFYNVPNPFTDQTSIQYVANGPAFVQIKVFNTLGQEVALLLDDFVDVFETDEVIWRGVDHGGKRVASGIYYCQISLSLPAGFIYKQTIPIALIK